jgi:hypothetical protein
MRYARDDRTKKIVDAHDIDGRVRFRAYSCPSCEAKVHYKRSIGLSPDPIFAHNPNEGSSDCENYFPWKSGFDDSPVPVPPAPKAKLAVEDSPEKIGLCLDDSSDKWSVYLRIPELTRSDLGTAALRSLASAFVEVKTGNKESRLSLIEIRPGVGSARLVVPPAVTPYKMASVGSWPAGIKRQRWQTETRGLSVRGTLFRLRHGEWVRLIEGSPVEYGEELRFVADQNNPPPAECRPLLVAGPFINGHVWRMWRVFLPRCESRQFNRWLQALDIEAVEASWDVRLLGVPDAISSLVPIFATHRQIIARLRSPSDGEEADVRLSVGSSRTTESFATAPRSNTVRFETKEEQRLSDIKNALKVVPALEVSLGEITVRPWDGTVEVTFPSQLQELVVKIRPELEEIRVNMFWENSGNRGLDVAISPSTVLHRLKTLAGERRKTAVRIDGGGLGVVSLTMCPAVRNLSALSKTDLRRALWLSTATQKVSVATGAAAWVQRHVATLEPRLLSAASRVNGSRWGPLFVRLLRTKDKRKQT